MILKVLGSGSAGNCYLLQSSKGEILIVECGIDIKEIKKALNFNFSNVVGCLISHEHKDHCKQVFNLHMLGISLYMSEGTLKAINSDEQKVRSKILQEAIPYNIGNFIIIPFGIKHDALEPLGFLIEHEECGTILFVTDTYYIPCNFTEFEINHAMVECNYSIEILKQNNQLEKLESRIIKSHFELENVKDFFRANNFEELKNIVLLHLSNSNSNEEIFKNEIENLTETKTAIADKGLEINLNLYEF